MSEGMSAMGDLAPSAYDIYLKSYAEDFPVTGDAYTAYLETHAEHYDSWPEVAAPIQYPDLPGSQLHQAGVLSETEPIALRTLTGKTATMLEDATLSENKPPEIVTPDKKQLKREFEQSQAKLRRHEYRCVATAFAGVLGMLASYEAVENMPRVATTMIDHDARAAVFVMLATVGWGSLAAFGLGSLGAYGSHADRKDGRKAFKTASRKANAVRSDAQPVYVFARAP
jgi:hypothetical protein